MYSLYESKRFAARVSGVDLRKGLNGHFHLSSPEIGLHKSKQETGL